MSPAGRNGHQSLLRQSLFIGALGALLLMATALPLERVVLPPGWYLPLHTTLEFLAAMAAFLVFATVWHTPAKETSASLVWISAGLLATGWLDMGHALSFSGMPDFITPSSTEKGIAFWLFARLVIALTLAVVSFLPELEPPSRSHRRLILLGYTLVNMVVFAMVTVFPDKLPATFHESQGLTDFKVGLEWLITLLLAVAAWRYYRQARVAGDEFSTLIFGATAVAALSEVFFTRYQAPTDLQNLLGHLYKIISYTLIYRAMFVTSVHRPYERLAMQTEQLSRANETLRTQALALESTVTPVLVADPQGRILWRNRASHRILGDDEHGLDHLSLYTAPVTPDPAVAATLRSSLSAGQIWRGFVELKDRRGVGMIMNRIVTPLRNEHGDIAGFVSVSEDVTQMLRAQQRHKRVLDTAIDGFWIMGPQGQLLEANEAYARMSGYTVAELLTMHLRDLEANEDEAAIAAHMEKIMRSGHEQFETRHRHKSGHEILVEVSATFDQEARQFFVFIRDITDKKQSALAKQDLERQLQQAQKMEALGQLTGGIAHDFNNILASVLGYSRLALDRLVPDKESKLASYLREIITASERARDLIAKMLAFTRTQPNRQFEAIAPAAVVKEVLAMIRPSIPSNIALELQVEDDPKIRVDSGELNQILVNLVINARDAIDGNGVIAIRQHRVDGGGRVCAISHQRLSGVYLAIEVSDNGSGIAPAHVPRLFDPFFTTKDVGKGTGLGLSMVQGILRRSGGSIVVESRPGHGSTFQLLFPLVIEAEADGTTPTLAPDAHDGYGEHVWVVDDEPAIARYLDELLASKGYVVSIFTSPAEVLARLKDDSGGPDILISDKTMPGMSGLELAAHLHRLRPDVPVIMCTGYSSGGGAVELPPYIRHCFIKPVNEHDLLQAIASELEQRALKTTS